MIVKLSFVVYTTSLLIDTISLQLNPVRML